MGKYAQLSRATGSVLTSLWERWHRSQRPQAWAGRTAVEPLESRQLLSTALYYDANATTAGLQAGNATWDLNTPCWSTAADGSGAPVAWISGADAYFNPTFAVASLKRCWRAQNAADTP